MLAAWVGAQAGFATGSGLGRCPGLGLGLGIGLVLVLAVDVGRRKHNFTQLNRIKIHMISVGHRSLSGRAIRLIIWSTEFEFESQIDLFLFNIKLFYKFSKSLIIRLFKALMKLPPSVG